MATAAKAPAPAETMTGAEAILRVLEENGVEVIFGYPGGAVLPIYDALFKNNAIRHILVRHEQAAVHALKGMRGQREAGCRAGHFRPRRHQCGDRATDALMDSILCFA